MIVSQAVCERPSFARRKTVKRTLKDGLLATKRRPFANGLIINDLHACLNALSQYTEDVRLKVVISGFYAVLLHYGYSPNSRYASILACLYVCRLLAEKAARP